MPTLEGHSSLFLVNKQFYKVSGSTWISEGLSSRKSDRPKFAHGDTSP